MKNVVLFVKMSFASHVKNSRLAPIKKCSNFFLFVSPLSSRVGAVERLFSDYVTPAAMSIFSLSCDTSVTCDITAPVTNQKTPNAGNNNANLYSGYIRIYVASHFPVVECIFFFSIAPHWLVETYRHGRSVTA